MLLAIAAALAMQTAPVGQDAPRLKPLNLEEWITEDDYPANALRNDEAGQVKFKLTVAGDGSVERCEITASSGFADLDAATCALITRRAKFSAPRPGMPYHSSVVWQIPPTPLRPIAAAHVAGVIRLSAEDAILGCEERSEGRIAAGMDAPCENFDTEIPPGMLDAIGGQGVPRVMTTEYVQRFGSDPEPARFYAEPGQILLGRRVVQFDITESGKVENCRDVPTGKEGILTFSPSPCTSGLGPFVPPLDAAGKPKATTGMAEMAISRMP